MRRSTLRTAGYVTGAVGLAGLVGAGVLTGVALAEKGTVDDHCPGRVCDSDGIDAAERGARLLRLADVSLVVGGAALAAGGILLWQSSVSEVRAGVTGSGVVATARWVLP